MRGRQPTAVVMTALAVLVTACLVSCSAPGSRSVPDATMAAFRSLLFQPAELGRAEALATQLCLREKGFDPPMPVALSGSVANLPRALDEATARTHGYGETLPTAMSGSDDSVDRYAQSLPAARQEEFQRALNDETAPRARFTTPSGWQFSASRGGCVAAGRAAVYGSVDNWLVAYYLPQDLNLLAADVSATASVDEAVQTYRVCMAREGFTIGTPLQAVEHAQTLASPAAAPTTPSTAEVRLAVADARCQALSQVVDVWLAEFERQAVGWIADNQAQVREASAIVGDAMARIDDIHSGAAA